MQDFRKVAVLGAGVMGSGIAAHLAGAGLDVLLLDIVPPVAAPSSAGAAPTKPQERNAFAIGALDKAMKSKPASFFSQRDRERISVGNLEDDLAAAGKCDLIIEVVKEDLAVKRALYAKLEPLLDAHTIVASNTSGLPIQLMMEGRSESMKKRFLVMHFFNPVRYMKLLEIVAGKDTDPDVVRRVATFGDEVLGKGIVYGKDTPNFVANRIGIFAMMHLIHLAVQEHYTVEEVDAIFGAPLGRPKSAVFRTADLVGLDTVVHVADNCYENLPHDEDRETFRAPLVLRQMVEKKMLGDKTGGGFMKKTPAGIVTLDLKTFEYREKQKPRFASVGAVKGEGNVRTRVAKFLAQPDDRAVKLAKQVTFATLAYATYRVGEIADDLVNIDRGMRWGFGWDLGPFETWDAIGVEKGLAEMKALGIIPAPWVGKMLASGQKSFYEGVDYFDNQSAKKKAVPVSARSLDLGRMRTEKKERIFGNDGASLWDVGDGIALLEFHTKMNALDADIISMLHKSVDEAEKKFSGLVVGNQAGDAFSAGANLFHIVMAAQGGQWKQLEEMISQLQGGLQRLKYASVPTVTAPYGLTLGGGAETVMQSSACRAHAELYMGLVEVGVGVIPAGGGCKELLARALADLPDDADPFPLVKKIFFNVAMAKVSMSAEEARGMGMLNPQDQITFNRDYLLYDAKQTALGMARAGYRAPRKRTFRVPGEGGYGAALSAVQAMKESHSISEHDLKVASKLAYTLFGGDVTPNVRVTEEHILGLEREAFLSLCGEPKSQERMQAMLMTGKPLRN
ncbi:MAG: 3-hydroxyacyl-CoA dehydrogenase/enoyl-CoA hydratase family protein [Polyangia bacterium]